MVNVQHLMLYQQFPEIFGFRATLDVTQAIPAQEQYGVESIIVYSYD